MRCIKCWSFVILKEMNCERTTPARSIFNPVFSRWFGLAGSESQNGSLIEEFEAKILDFFSYVHTSTDGERLIIKIKSHVSEAEIYEDFAKIYRRYKALNRQTVGDHFFKETEDLVDKLCDDFEAILRDVNE